MLVGRAWAGGAWAAGRVGRRWWRSAVLLPGVAGEAAPVGRRWWRARRWLGRRVGELQH